MKKGAFALLDCLGFKGIWNRAKPEVVLQSLIQLDKELQKQSLPITTGKLLDDTPIYRKIRLLSDTVVLSVTFRANEPTYDYPNHVLVADATNLLFEINRWFLEMETPLSLRGCLTFGEHLIEDNFIIGPAVDRAAELEKLPNGAFIWLDEKAATLYREHDQSFKQLSQTKPGIAEINLLLSDESLAIEQRIAFLATIRTDPIPFVVDYNDFPLKGGDRLNAAVLNPVSIGLADTIRTLYKKAMLGDRIDVTVKRQQTLKFLDFCEGLTESHYSSFAAEKNRIAGLVACGAKLTFPDL